MQKKFKDYFTSTTISNIFTIIVGVSVYLAILNFSVVSGFFATIYKVMSPFVYAFVLAFLLNTPVNWFENKVFKKAKLKKTWAIIMVYIITFSVCIALVVAIGPQIMQSVVSVMENVPKYLESITGIVKALTENYNFDPQIAIELEETWATIVKAISGTIMSAIPKILNFSVSTGNLIINSLMAIIASVYMLVGKERLIFQMKKMIFAYIPNKKANKMITIGKKSNAIFSKFLNGKILDSFIIGVLCFIGMIFIYPPYALLISIIIGVTNMIPFFGPFIGAIPSIFILLMVQPLYAIAFMFFVFILQQFDGNILGPKILGDSTGLSAIWVLVAIVVGGGLFGFTGMLVGVPTFAVLYGLVSENIDKNLEIKNITADRNTLKIAVNGSDDKNEASL